jgi:NitT/TauT family transport system ATP-binding protein
VLTHSPTEVKEIVPVDLPRPRDQLVTKELPEFVHLRGHVYRLIKREQESGPPAPKAEQANVPHAGTPV